MGHLSDRLGPGRVLAVTGLACGIGYALISQVTEPWQLLAIFAVLIGLGMSTHDVVTLSTVARCFDKRRGMITGVVKTGTAAGQMLLPVLTAFLVAAIGWREAAAGLGLAAAAILVIAAILISIPVKPVEARTVLQGQMLVWGLP